MITPESTSDPVIRARGLRKQYGTTTALAGVDLDIPRGRSLAIMGTSGSGKTTLLHCLAGIVVPDAGSVLLDGAGDVTAMNDAKRTELRRTRFGFVFQQAMLIPELTAIENVALPAMLGGRPRLAAMHSAAEWLGALGLAGMEGRRIGELSGGQAQRVAIARAQILRADVVFADEPTGALDSATSADTMHALVGSTVGDGRTLVVVTHDEQVAAACDLVVRMQDARVLDAFVPTAATTRATVAR